MQGVQFAGWRGVVNILFYGACHAGALQGIVDRFGPSGISTDRLHNFKLIQAGKPFPYDTLGQYDAVVFQPLVNRGEYNTDRLVDACAGLGIQSIAFPLIEWGGYFPGLVNPGNGKFRYYPELFRLSLEYNNFNAFEAFVIDGHEVVGAEAAAARATKMLRRMEEFGQSHITVSDLIEAGFRDERLMLLPQHPSRGLYSGIVRQLEDLLGFRVDPSFHYGGYEPQEEGVYPILPATIRALGLRFRNCEFVSSVFFGDARARSLREWLHMYYYAARNLVTYEVKADTVIKRWPSSLAAHTQEPHLTLKAGETLVAREGEVLDRNRRVVQVVVGTKRVAPGSEWVLQGTSWRRFDFRPPKA